MIAQDDAFVLDIDLNATLHGRTKVHREAVHSSATSTKEMPDLGETVWARDEWKTRYPAVVERFTRTGLLVLAIKLDEPIEVFQPPKPKYFSFPEPVQETSLSPAPHGSLTGTRA